MAAPPDPIIEDLRGLLQGEARADDLIRAQYATDASVLRLAPRAVVFPRGEDDVAATLGYCHERGIPVHPRGGGTGVAGGCLGPGLVLDMSWQRPPLPQPEADAVEAHAGVRAGELAELLARQGRWLPAQPRQAGGTIGGMIANDAAGPWSGRCGRMRDHLLAVRLALADGRIIEARREPPPAPGDLAPHAALRREVAALLAEHAEDIRLEQPANLPRPGGLLLRGALADGLLDLPRLLAGSEGTLGVLLSARLATQPLPAHRGVLLCGYRSFGAALDAALGFAESDPRACEVFDRRLLTLARQAEERFRGWTDERAEALLLVETEGASAANVAERLAKLAAQAGTREVAALADEASIGQAWRALRQAAASLGRRDGAAAPLEVAEGCAVPPSALPEFFRAARALLQERRVTAAFAARPATGQLLLRPMVDLRTTESRYLLPELCEGLAAAARALGGTFHAEDGAGLLRAGLLPAQFPRLQAAFRRLKRAFDPHGILNQGRLSEAPSGFPLDLLRPWPTPPAEAALPAEAAEPLTVVELAAAARCNGCGACRGGQASVRMCPSFKALPEESASPRALANVLRELASGALDPARLADDDLRALAGNCVDCRMCRVECPAGVDIPALALAAKAAHVAEHGLDRSGAFFAKLHEWSAWAAARPRLYNLLIGSRIARFAIERSFGVSRARRLPRVARQPFQRLAAELGWTTRSAAAGRKAALFADTFAAFHDPLIGVHAGKVLLAAGVAVHVPAEQTGSGMAALQHGDLDGAAAAAARNAAVFADLARDGYEIVALEPSGALFLRDDAVRLGVPDAALVAERTYEFTEYLGLLAAEGLLPRPSHPAALPAVGVGYHQPCHLRALNPRSDVLAALRTLPNIKLAALDHGCSGMAGTHGLTRAGAAASLAAGRGLFERFADPGLAYGLTQCSACRLQIEEGAGKRTIHPAHWFALAHGVAEPRFQPFRRVRRGLRA